MIMAIKEGQKVGVRIVLGDEYIDNECFNQYDGGDYLSLSIEERIEAVRHDFIDMKTECREHDDWKKDHLVAFAYNARHEKKMTNAL